MNKITIVKKLRIILMVVIFISFFISYYDDFFDVCENDWYDRFQNDSDAYIYGKILNFSINEKQDDTHFLGRYRDDEGIYDQYRININTFLKDGAKINNEYDIYFASIGIQGDFYKLLYVMLQPLPNNVIHDSFIIITAILLSITMFLIVYWVMNEFGLVIGVIGTFSIITMPWLTVMGKSLFWFYWTDFLPFIAVLYYLFYIEKNEVKYSGFILNTLIFITVLISVSAGYEFVTTVLIAMVTPVFYYSVKQRWKVIITISRLISIIITSITSFTFSLFILLFKIRIYHTGNMGRAIDILKQRIAKRTGFFQKSVEIDKVYQDSLQAPIIDTIKAYLSDGDSGVILGANAMAVISLVILGVIIYLIIKNRGTNIYIKKQYKKIEAMIIMILVSLLAPFSWFVLANGHSAIHLHINYIVWSLPFAILACIFIGIIFIGMIYELSNLRKNKNVSNIN